MNGPKVVAALTRAMEERGSGPDSITLDNGSKFTRRAMEWFTSLDHAAAKLAQWRDHYNHQRPHSALDDRAPSAFARLHGAGPTRSALPVSHKPNSEPRQGFAPPADAALDPVRWLAEDIHYEGEALLRIAQNQSPLLSLWSDLQARKSGSGGPWPPGLEPAYRKLAELGIFDTNGKPVVDI